jgi:hypothetical protein
MPHNPNSSNLSFNILFSDLFYSLSQASLLLVLCLNLSMSLSKQDDASTNT